MVVCEANIKFMYLHHFRWPRYDSHSQIIFFKLFYSATFSAVPMMLLGNTSYTSYEVLLGVNAMCEQNLAGDTVKSLV